MCKCTPGVKTPFCGKPGCEYPAQVPTPRQMAEDLLRKAERYRDTVRGWLKVAESQVEKYRRELADMPEDRGNG